jgi:hypothetical protein
MLQPSLPHPFWFIIHYPTIPHCLCQWLQLQHLMAGWWVTNWKTLKTSVRAVCVPAKIWTTCWTQVKPEPTCCVTAYLLSELLTWLSKKKKKKKKKTPWAVSASELYRPSEQLQKLRIHYRPDAHKAHFSNTATEHLLVMPSEYETNCLNFRKESKWTLTVQINFIPWFWKGLPSSNTRVPTLTFRSIHDLSCSRLLCVQCLQPICEQTKHMPVLSEWKHCWASVPQWEHTVNSHSKKIFLWTGKIVKVRYFWNKAVMCLYSSTCH